MTERHYFLTELNDGIQWLTDGQDFGMNPDAARDLLKALKRALATTQEIERSSHQRHFNPGTLQEMANAIAKAEGSPLAFEGSEYTGKGTGG